MDVIVADTNNFSPIFGNKTYEFRVTETNKSHVVIGSLTAYDDDRGRNGNVTFSMITDINPDGIFNLSNQVACFTLFWSTLLLHAITFKKYLNLFILFHNFIFIIITTCSECFKSYYAQFSFQYNCCNCNIF